MNKILVLILITSTSLLGVPFSKTKKMLLKQVYKDNKNTFYCNNPYEIRVKKGKQKALIVQDEKFYTPRNRFTKKGKLNQRTLKLEWEHIMPAHNFGRHLPCWKDGGRKACRKDKTFKRMESDMHNLVPSIGEVNGDRSNYRYGANKPNKTQYGNCNVQIDFKDKRAYVDDSIKGDIARTYFYMSDKYNVKLSKQERKMLEAWNKLDPVDNWERTKNKRVEKIQGNGNPYIK